MPLDDLIVRNTREWLARARLELPAIGAHCVEADPSLRALVDRVAHLSQYAQRFRYPGDPYEPSSDEARQALQFARETFEAILNRLPAETHL